MGFLHKWFKGFIFRNTKGKVISQAFLSNSRAECVDAVGTLVWLSWDGWISSKHQGKAQHIPGQKPSREQTETSLTGANCFISFFSTTKLSLWDTNAGVWKPPTPLLQLLLAEHPAHGTQISQLHGIIWIAAFSESWIAFAARLSESLHAGVDNYTAIILYCLIIAICS